MLFVEWGWVGLFRILFLSLIFGAGGGEGREEEEGGGMGVNVCLIN